MGSLILKKIHEFYFKRNHNLHFFWEVDHFFSHSGEQQTPPVHRQFPPNPVDSKQKQHFFASGGNESGEQHQNPMQHMFSERPAQAPQQFIHQQSHTIH